MERVGRASEDLMIMHRRIFGAAEAQGFFRAQAQLQEKPRWRYAERDNAICAGARTRGSQHLWGPPGACKCGAQLVGRASVSVQDLLAVADESAGRCLEYSSQLEIKSRGAEQIRAGRKLRRRQ